MHTNGKPDFLFFLSVSVALPDLSSAKRRDTTKHDSYTFQTSILKYGENKWRDATLNFANFDLEFFTSYLKLMCSRQMGGLPCVDYFQTSCGRFCISLDHCIGHISLGQQMENENAGFPSAGWSMINTV